MAENEAIKKVKCDCCSRQILVRGTCTVCRLVVCTECTWGVVFNSNIANGPSYLICKKCQERSE